MRNTRDSIKAISIYLVCSLIILKFVYAELTSIKSLGSILEKYETKEITIRKNRIHPITIIHPGDPQSNPLKLELIQYLDDDSNPEEYSLWVDSVICRDSDCDVVKVKLTWDALGRYKNYVVEKGEDLTKLDHVVFTREDHNKLQSILMDLKSPLSEVTKEGLIGGGSQGVDGVSGATVLTLGQNVVIGAGYTCYDLWHWANGEVCSLIREHSSKITSQKKLSEYLNSKDEHAIQFALTNFYNAKVFSQKNINDTLEAMEYCSQDLVPFALKFLKAAQNESSYQESIMTIMKHNDAKKSILLIESLWRYDEAPLNLITNISKFSNQFTTYPEVHRFLSYIEEKECANKEILDNVAQLLNHSKFFFSRRTYWFLKEQKLAHHFDKQLKEYEAKYQDRL